MTVPALDVLRDFTACPHYENVDALLHSGCRWCAELEDRGVPSALADLEALVQAAQLIPHRLHKHDGPYLYLNADDTDALHAALARVLGESS